MRKVKELKKNKLRKQKWIVYYFNNTSEEHQAHRGTGSMDNTQKGNNSQCIICIQSIDLSLSLSLSLSIAVTVFVSAVSLLPPELCVHSFYNSMALTL